MNTTDSAERLRGFVVYDSRHGWYLIECLTETSCLYRNTVFTHVRWSRDRKSLRMGDVVEFTPEVRDGRPDQWNGRDIVFLANSDMVSANKTQVLDHDVKRGRL